MVKTRWSGIFRRMINLKKSPIFLQNSFFWLLPEFNPLILLCTLKMVHNNVLYYSAKTACMEKIWFFSYGMKCTQLIRLQCSLITSMFERNQFFAWKESSKKDSILSVIFGWVLPDVLVVQSDCSIL